MTEKTPVVELKNVSLRFGSLLVHQDISFKVYPNETVTILGPSGTGKTLILKMIMGLIRPSSGDVFVMGQNLNGLSEFELRDIRRKIGMVFQGAALFDSLPVFENLAYSLRESGQKSEELITDVVHESLEIVGLPGIAHKFPLELSGGQKKRVGLARALVSSPKVVLFDEPTTGLDPTAIKLIDDLILKLKRSYSMTSIVVTHDIESAKRISNRWILIDKGHIIADGPVIEVCCKNEDVIEFITGNWKDDNTKQKASHEMAGQ